MNTVWFYWKLEGTYTVLSLWVGINIKAYAFGSNLWELHGCQPCLFLFTYPLHCVPWCYTVTAAFHREEAQHTSSSRAFWQRICQYFNMFCAGEERHVFYALQSNRFYLLLVKKSRWVLDLAKENSRVVCLVPLKWNMNRSSIWS